MQKNPRIDELLDDLYAIDPSLREHQDRLKEMLEDLRESRPNITVDARFAASLRATLLSAMPSARPSRPRSVHVWRPFAIGGGAVALVAIVVAALGPSAPVEAPTVLSSESGRAVVTLAPGAFGSFTADDSMHAESSSEGTSVAAPTAPLALAPSSNGDESSATRSTKDGEAVDTALPNRGVVGSSGGYGGGGMAMGMAVAPPELGNDGQWHPYELKYVGDALPELPSDAQVYRTAFDADAAGAMAAGIRSVANGMLDVGVLSSPAVRSVQLAGDDGSFMNLDLWSGRAFIGREDLVMPVDGAPVRQFTAEDVPADDVLIGAANAFLSRYGVDLTGYGDPVVDDRWKASYAHTDARYRQAPRLVSVIYPLRIEGDEVRDQGGSPYGITVLVDAVDRRAVNASNVLSQRFERSSYAAETSATRIVGIAERGGIYGFGWGGPEPRTIRLGTPELSYVQTFHVLPGESRGSELYVPALLFPVLDDVDDYGNRPTVVVPLVRELLDDAERQMGDARTPVPYAVEKSMAPAMPSDAAAPEVTPPSASHDEPAN